MSGNVLEIFKTHLKETISAQTILLPDPKMVENFEHANDECLKTYLNQGKILSIQIDIIFVATFS